MADQSGANAQLAAPAEQPPVAAEPSKTAPEASKGTAPSAETAATESEPVKPAAEAAVSAGDSKEPTEKPVEKAGVQMKDAPETAPAASDSLAEAASAPADEAAPAVVNDAVAPSVLADKSKLHRKSTGGADKAKKLSKKASKARITHLDAKPGDHYFHKLKGHPTWPVIICDEDMLPHTLLKSRPVTAVRMDGTYRADYADGGKRAADRTYPVMYLATNEFGWAPNTDLHDLDPTTVLEAVNDKMRKDLQRAHQLASEANPLNHYKELLQQFQEELEEAAKAKAQAQATPSKKSKKNKASADEEDEDGDVDMADAGDDEPATEKKSKKRKAEDDTATPQRSDSVKKPKFKVITNSTPKAANGVPTPKSGKASESKPTKSKTKKEVKSTEDKKAEKEAQVPKEPELTPEEKHQRKEKEVLFLRHKLQKGLLTRDQEPKVEEMKMMSDYVAKLEGFPDLEVSIIRATKINKVLKAILKLESIPKEDEFQFKPRSQALLDKWNKLLAVDGSVPIAGPATVAANGVNGKSGENAGAAKEDAPKAEKVDAANGVKANGEIKAEAPAAEAKPAEASGPQEAKTAAEESSKASEAVESAA